MGKFCPESNKTGANKKAVLKVRLLPISTGGATRTPDTWFWRPVLYQLSYTRLFAIANIIIHPQIPNFFPPGLLNKLACNKNGQSEAPTAHFAEREGFEPPVPRGTTVFKTAAFDHSAISPSATKVE